MRKFNVTVDGQTYEIEVEEVGAEGGQTAPAPKAPASSGQPAKSGGGSSSGGSAAPASSGAPAGGSGGGGGEIKAPIAGNVLEIKVSEGDQVEKGQVVMILEAMKMENEITAESGGTVKDVKASKGASVDSGETLIVLE